MKTKHMITIDEGQRGAILLALAELSIARPGWLHMLEEIALLMDNCTTEGKAQMFEGFRLNHSNYTAAVLAGTVDPVRLGRE